MADLEALPVTAAPVDEKTEAKSPTGRRDRAVSFKSIAEAPQGSFSPREVRDPSAAYERINTLRGRGTADGTTANVGAEVPPAQRLSDMTDSTSLIIGQGGAVTAIILPGYIQARGEIKIDSDGKGGDIVKMGVDALVVKTQFPAKGSSEALVTAQVPACPAFQNQFPGFLNCLIDGIDSSGRMYGIKEHKSEINLIGGGKSFITRTSPIVWANEGAVPVVVGNLEGQLSSNLSAQNIFSASTGTSYHRTVPLLNGVTAVDGSSAGFVQLPVKLVDAKDNITDAPNINGRPASSIVSASPKGTSIILSDGNFFSGETHVMYTVNQDGKLTKPIELGKVNQPKSLNSRDFLPNLSQKLDLQIGTEAKVTNFTAAYQPFNTPAGAALHGFAVEDKTTITGKVTLEIPRTHENGSQDVIRVDRAGEVKVDPSTGTVTLSKVHTTDRKEFGPDGATGSLNQLDRGQALKTVSQLEVPGVGTFTFLELQKGNPQKQNPVLGISFRDAQNGESTQVGEFKIGLEAMSGVKFDQATPSNFQVGASANYVYLQVGGAKSGSNQIIRVTPETLRDIAYSAY